MASFDLVHTTKWVSFQTILHLWEYEKVTSNQVRAVGWMGKHSDVFFSQKFSDSQSTVTCRDADDGATSSLTVLTISKVSDEPIPNSLAFFLI